MTDSYITKRNQNQDQKQFSISDRSSHIEKYPFLLEFSELIADVSTKDLKNNLLTPEQKMLAESFWMSNKNKIQSDPSYRPEKTKLRQFYENVLKIDHKQQWDEYRKRANITSDKHLE